MNLKRAVNTTVLFLSLLFIGLAGIWSFAYLDEVVDMNEKTRKNEEYNAQLWAEKRG